jgi:Cof subfamily protein (haloacid dehalogenase superfamily)
MPSITTLNKMIGPLLVLAAAQTIYANGNSRATAFAFLKRTHKLSSYRIALLLAADNERDQSRHVTPIDSAPFIDTPDHGRLNQPSKSDLYSNDELLGLLELHSSLAAAVPEIGGEKGRDTPDSGAMGKSDGPVSSTLQDLIQHTVQDINDSCVDGKAESTAASALTLEHSSTTFQSSLDLADFKRIVPSIRAIASDVDGTLLSSNYTLHPLTRRAIRNALEAAFSPMHPLQHFVLATGKTRAGALNSLGPEMQTLLRQVPGVYVQGLYCVDATGKVVFEQKLSQIAVQAAEELAKGCGLSLIAYDGDQLFASPWSHSRHTTDLCQKWGEPLAKIWDDGINGSLADYSAGFHKLLLMGDHAEQLTNDVRPQLEALAATLGCVVTQAIPVMLELLPTGCSKAVGVQKLCEHLGLDLSVNVCAIGDAENDIDMLRLAAIGVAVGNAAPLVKEVANVVLTDTNNEGAAGRAIELFGLGRVIDLLDGRNSY